MRHYYHTTSTRGHGLAVLMCAVPFLALCGFGLSLAWNESGFDKGAVLALIFVCALAATAVFFLAVALRHTFHPQQAFVEITDTELRWRDWNLFGMRADSQQLTRIRAVKLPTGEDALPFLELNTGLTMTLPTLVIPNQNDFNAALQRAAPHIAVDDRF
ncbi:MAG TPA: hypothetical protein VD994_21200 [Prosthecobacter sp.]|nr:hypothetical protein [Prosthecobacter sp.]